MSTSFLFYLHNVTLHRSGCKRLLSHTGADASFRIVVMSNGGEAMKVVTLCSCGSCCPVVKLAVDRVEIGEEGNLCVLTLDEWETLKRKILDKEM